MTSTQTVARSGTAVGGKRAAAVPPTTSAFPPLTAMDLIAPILSYVVAQAVGWLWARGRTTFVASPRLREGTPVKLPDGTAGTVVRR